MALIAPRTRMHISRTVMSDDISLRLMAKSRVTRKARTARDWRAMWR